MKYFHQKNTFVNKSLRNEKKSLNNKTYCRISLVYSENLIELTRKKIETIKVK